MKKRPAPGGEFHSNQPSEWSGYMGVALAITEDRYFYWMYSDAGLSGDEPCTGTYSLADGILHLEKPTWMRAKPPGDNHPEPWLYSHDWKVVQDGAVTHLHSITDQPDDRARTLMLDVSFDPQKPFENQSALETPELAPNDPHS